MGKLKLTKTKILGALLALAFIPSIVLADLSPVLDKTNLYQIANRNVSATWGTNTTAKPGDTMSFMIHIHNNVYDTFAENVRVQAVLPNVAVKSYNSVATVSADNASPVSGTVSFVLSQTSNVAYIPGSTVLYDHNNNVVRTLPDGITGNGITIGNIQGCYEYEQWVIFKAKVVAKVTPPTPTPTPIPERLPVSGPIDAAAGIVGTMGLGSAAYFYRKSRLRLKNSHKKF